MKRRSVAVKRTLRVTLWVVLVGAAGCTYYVPSPDYSVTTPASFDRCQTAKSAYWIGSSGRDRPA